jgi:hypothetical protein
MLEDGPVGLGEELLLLLDSTGPSVLDSTVLDIVVEAVSDPLVRLGTEMVELLLVPMVDVAFGGPTYPEVV